MVKLCAAYFWSMVLLGVFCWFLQHIQPLAYRSY